MKRIDLVKAITDLGCVLERRGGKHDWYRNPTTSVCQPIPRHRGSPNCTFGFAAYACQ